MEKKNRDFELFKREFTKWQERFGLTGFRVYFRYAPLEDKFASIVYDIPGMVANVTLNSKLNKDMQPCKDIKFVAKHEAAHLLFARMEILAGCRFATKDGIDEASEELANKIANLIR